MAVVETPSADRLRAAFEFIESCDRKNLDADARVSAIGIALAFELAEMDEKDREHGLEVTFALVRDLLMLMDAKDAGAFNDDGSLKSN